MLFDSCLHESGWCFSFGYKKYQNMLQIQPVWDVDGFLDMPKDILK